jgi:hypothetical protein
MKKVIKNKDTENSNTTILELTFIKRITTEINNAQRMVSIIFN